MLNSSGQETIEVADRDEINVGLAVRLVAEQFPEWADLPVVPVSLNGWDNTTFRLGDPASDLTMTWTFFEGTAPSSFDMVWLSTGTPRRADVAGLCGRRS